ncbi:hypothetical protein VDGD_21557 [Verticillium dahliae]|nr:hypothetical protein VDGD_21557 [Verticillium dahliae]
MHSHETNSVRRHDESAFLISDSLRETCSYCPSSAAANGIIFHEDDAKVGVRDQHLEMREAFGDAGPHQPTNL